MCDFFLKDLGWDMGESKKYIKRMAIISAVFAGLCLIFMAVFLPMLLEERRAYEKSSEDERALLAQLNEINIRYYTQLMTDGFFTLKDSEQDMWTSSIYPRIARLYKYRLYINGKIYNYDEPSIYYYTRDGFVSLRIEEYIDSAHSVYSIPRATLKQYSNLLTRGTGELIDIADSITVEYSPDTPSSGEKPTYEDAITVRTYLGEETDNYISAIEITIETDISAFTDISLIFRGDEKNQFIRTGLKGLWLIEVRNDIN